ncbi:UDP-N-Acetylglucosamine 2-epimerase [Thermoanaerobacter thermohydrosulfuricus]|uniref:UDP-N-acetylglucosamine 2-epimerase (non-hydrolyzing) n=2 Tax=Thermoanaerobacter thermohydrosulfuricus TaxID=1516 RepID=M8CQI1_THETY|nr:MULTISPECIES: UDP-N-acetylglucosamine 2-epimerase (non-hydrolyzing) [Thermoanaerobacter]EMT39410.1 UDP-N-acetylglucosamine 2-epimerase [Thermoanaerobacter thermohydrosulfuricus WC1]UZQ83156.1 UDP-N-acetylglucosamine 2-epimerase (non-hydrolyzing) [Thermoanaerobacter sp. RKWS2]SDF98368.1 UDP-N-Acetylglucosamine 2-epimerase [Thermoanaerobacter thermohydrosulfuricus]SFE67338.1 UDP-N-Acetylglucosamine 2-epimerase [Thermoanaerobacter thermohydrosulfuricus]
MTLKIISVFGTRPEAIKMAPLIKALEREKDFESKVCVTAQHREMLDQVLRLFNITPHYDLNIMKEKQTLSEITTSALIGLERVFNSEKPDLVLVHGDTTTTFAAALAAFYHKIKVGHVEAGLRSFNKWFPYPEEINRKLTGVLTDLHFAPTSRAKLNLLKEGVSEESIFVTGNTVIDAMAYTVKEDYVFRDERLNQIDYNDKKVIVVTAHRRENWGKPLENICNALKRIAQNYKDVYIVYPVHKNPVVRETVFSMLGELGNVLLLDPLDTDEMHNLMAKCHMVMTDSGGLQEEVPSLGKPVLVLRDVTERPEAVEAGTVKVIGTEQEVVYNEGTLLLENKEEYDKMANAVNPYGDGKASLRIIQAIKYAFNLSDTKPEEYKSGE